MLESFNVSFIFIILGLSFVFLVLLAGKLIRPDHPNSIKNSTYECGEDVVGSGWLNYNIRFYLIALIFIIFDLEIAFIFPVGVAYRSLVESGAGVFVFWEMFVFIAILLLALLYVWVKGDIEWAKDFIRGGKKAVFAFEKPLQPQTPHDGRKS